ncbi:hypothetical protein Pmani_010228 [Petrolisthes manimaculis]|uniref:Uncharacterized protein n=1 Tax=Petrolisthes manimaculis TaxID=1843537 RepID=A0AAE1Q3J8_9EUCA|nr:hypothetical protein Pmani_010228 [Petrolisthes manimaculis]
MADNLNDTQTAAARHTNTVSPATSVPMQEDDIAALTHTPSRFHQHPGSQHHKPKRSRETAICLTCNVALVGTMCWAERK